MKKKQIIVCVLWLITYFFAYSMDQALTPSYEEFKFNLPYGTFKLNFLSPDIIDNHIRPYIAQALAIKYKHMTIKHKDLRKSRRESEGILQVISLGSPNIRTFLNHDGTYIIVPDIGNEYAMCDEISYKQYLFSNHSQDENDLLKQILRGKNKQDNCIKIYRPKTQLTRKQNTDIYIKTDVREKKVHLQAQSVINQAIMSHNSKWLMMSILQSTNNAQLVNLKTLMIETIPIHEEIISAICSAHHSSKFVACAQNGNTYVITPRNISLLPKLRQQNNHFIYCAQFSPNDRQLITYGSNILQIWWFTKNSEKNISYDYKQIAMENTIRKALFTPDGTAIIIAIKNGIFDFYDSKTGENLRRYFPQWRLKPFIHFDKKPPLIVCGAQSKLLISLDPVQSVRNRGYTFVIRKMSGKFDFLAEHNFHPNNPVVMGLTKDEQSIAFIDNHDQASLLNLYDEEDISCINFIENTADIFLLCKLLDLHKKLKPNRHGATVSAFINAVHNYAQFHQK